MLSMGLWEWQEVDEKYIHTPHSLSLAPVVFFLLYMNKSGIHQSREWEKEHVYINNKPHFLEHISYVPVCLFLL